MGRLVLIVLILIGISAVPFLIWGKGLEQALSLQGAADFMRGFGDWAWLAGIGLVMLDIFLPIPASAVMAALGIIYGPVIGGALAASGSMLAGLVGYGLCRILGPRTARYLAGDDGFEKTRGLFTRWGGWLVAGSRWLPILPETVAFLAGLTAMPFMLFTLALACGSVPLGFAYATAGHLGADNVPLTLGLSAVAPLGLWLLARPLLARAEARG